MTTSIPRSCTLADARFFVVTALACHLFTMVFFISKASADSSDSGCADAPDPDSVQPLPPPLSPECSNQNSRPSQVENTSCPSHRHAPPAPQAPRGRRQQWEFKGGRRDRGKGGGGRGGHRAQAVPPPVLENLAKLSVSAAESSRNSGALQDTKHGDRRLVVIKELPRRALGNESVETSQQETPESNQEQHVTDGVQPGARERRMRQEQDRGRRHGAHGPPYSHWHERNAQWDNGGYIHHHRHRGARGHRAGHHRGNGKNWHQRTESELRKEGVL